ncbi:hypothetical protein SCHPADRAFT_385304 [Schizopora paradoxa]|uniref:Uncharacterized protein n=1 Tax=Schizopora paradoxa TaxID=27342 RepID=A0A0H2RM54_9AGAM|nr:hypothetical protein SCHPADRAFT_385304 [Schizopora paradoxa]
MKSSAPRSKPDPMSTSPLAILRVLFCVARLSQSPSFLTYPLGVQAGLAYFCGEGVCEAARSTRLICIGADWN